MSTSGKPRVVITGMGAVTNLGHDAVATWASMREGRSGITRIEGEEFVEFEGHWDCKIGGQVKAWDLHFRGEKPLVLPGTVDNAGWIVRRPGQPPRPIAFALSTESIKLDKDNPTGELRMVGEDGFGIRVSQVLRFRADSYVVEHELKVENRHTVAQGVELA